MRFSNCKNYLIRIILSVLFLFMIGSCFWEEPKKDKSSDIFVWLLLAYLSDPPYRLCTEIPSTYVNLEKGITRSNTIIYAENNVNDYVLYPPLNQRITIKIELKSDCSLYRIYSFCSNNRKDTATSDEHRIGISCSDNTVLTVYPLKGKGYIETCNLTFGATRYTLSLYTENTINREDCQYEITYDY